MLNDHRFYRPKGSAFSTLRNLHTHNLDTTSGLNDLTERFASFLTRARYFSHSLRRTWSYSAIEFMKYRRRLPTLMTGDTCSSEEGDITSSASHFDSTSQQDGIKDLFNFNFYSLFHARIDNKKVLVNNIHHRVTTRQLASFFNKFGKVVSCSLPVDKGGTLGRSRSRGLGYVTFSNVQEAELAKTACADELTYYGKTMSVSQVLPLTKRHSVAVVDPSSGGVKMFIGDDDDSRASTPTSPMVPAMDSGIISASVVHYFDLLPDSCVVRLFELLPIVDRIRSERVSKRFLELSNKSWSDTSHLRFDNMFSVYKGKPLKNPILQSLLRRAGAYLRSIDVSGAPEFLDERSLQLICQYTKQERLQRVDLTGLRLRWRGLKGFVEQTAQLESFTLRNSYYLGEKGLYWLLRQCQRLKYLDLSGNRLIKGNSLEEIHLSGCLRLEPSGVEDLCRQAVNLSVLDLDDCCRVNDENLAHISRLDRLKVFRLSGETFPSLTSRGLCSLHGAMPHLQELYLVQNKLVNDDVIVALATSLGGTVLYPAPLLQTLSLSGAGEGGGLTESGLLSLAACCSLREIDLSYLPSATDKVLLALASNCPELKVVRLRSCVCITDSTPLTLLSKCRGMWELDLSGCLRISNAGVRPFFDRMRIAAGDDESAPMQSRTHLCLTLILGGTGCDIRQLELLQVSSVVIDSSDLTRSYLMPESVGGEQPTASTNFHSPRLSSTEEQDTEAADEDEAFLAMCDQPSFILESLEEEEDLNDEELALQIENDLKTLNLKAL